MSRVYNFILAVFFIPSYSTLCLSYLKANIFSSALVDNARRIFFPIRLLITLFPCMYLLSQTVVSIFTTFYVTIVSFYT